MNLNFHDKLNYLSEASNDTEFANRALGGQNKLSNVAGDTDLAQKVSSSLEDFLKDNQENIAISDNTALKKLQGVVYKFELETGLKQKQDGKPSTLEKTLSASLALTSIGSLNDIHLPNDLNKILLITPHFVQIEILARIINRDAVPIKDLNLTKQQLLEIGPLLTHLDCQNAFDNSWTAQDIQEFLNSCCSNLKLLSINSPLISVLPPLPLCQTLDCTNCLNLRQLNEIPLCQKFICKGCNSLAATGIPEKLPKAVEDAFYETIFKPKLILLCKKHGVEVWEYPVFMRSFNKLNINGQSGKGVTPIIKAIQDKQIGMLKVLIDLGADINKCDHEGISPINAAILYNNADIVRILTNSGVDVNKCDDHGDFPFIFAVVNQQPEMVKLLKELNANINILDKRGYSALHLATLDDQFEMVRLLKEFGLDINGCNKEGDTALLLAVFNRQHKMVCFLKELGVDINKSNDNGDTALHLAALDNQIEMVELLKELKADIDKPNKKGNTPFLLAIGKNNIDVVNILKEWGADITKSNIMGCSALHIAAGKNNLEMVKLLYDWGLDVNQCDTSGSSPLMQAVLKNDVNMVRLLAELKANVNKNDKDGRSPIMLAMQRNYIEMETMLREELGADSEYAKIANKKIILAHIWGLTGTSTWIDKKGISHTVSLEGCSKECMLERLFTYNDEFFKNSESNDPIRNDVQLKIQKTIINSFPLLPTIDDKKIEEIQQGIQPFALLAGTKDHAISMVIHQGKLFVFNRGIGRQANSTTIYPLSSKDINADLIKRLTTTYSDIEIFNAMIEKYFPKSIGGFKKNQKDQEAGNCTWASTKGIFGILWNVLADENSGTEIYKNFTDFARQKSLLHYLQSMSGDEQDKDDIILKIKQKCIEKEWDWGLLTAPKQSKS